MQLKFIFILFFELMWQKSVDAYPPYIGQPGCQTEEELQVKYYRHLTNKTLYWKCEKLGEPAVLKHCPNGQGYLDSIKACINFSKWYWTPGLEMPLSMPKYWTDIYSSSTNSYNPYYQPNALYASYGPYNGQYGPYGPIYKPYYGPYGPIDKPYYGPYGPYGPYGSYGLYRIYG